MLTFKEISSTLVDKVFDGNPTATDLLTLVATLAVFWAVTLSAFSAWLKPRVVGKPWLIAAGIRDYEHGGKELHEDLGVPKTREEFVDNFMDWWPWTLSFLIQHFVGGLLCLPAILGVGNASVASSLACLGILSEMGWEVEDTAQWLAKRYLTPDGKAAVPSALLAVLVVHHSLTTLLGLPTVLYYRDLNTLHWICFNLQAAAAIAGGVAEYTKLLDVSKPNELRQFKALTFFALVTMVWTRGLHWAYLCCKFIGIWYADRAWGFLVIGSCMILVFSGFNYALVIKPYYVRFRKFMNRSAEYAALPADAEERVRRKSVVSMQAAAADVSHCLSGEGNDVDFEVASLCDKLLVGKRISRRQTMPPSFTASNKRRSSVVLLRASSTRVLSKRDLARPSLVQFGRHQYEKRD